MLVNQYQPLHRKVTLIEYSNSKRSGELVNSHSLAKLILFIHNKRHVKGKLQPELQMFFFFFFFFFVFLLFCFFVFCCFFFCLFFSFCFFFLSLEKLGMRTERLIRLKVRRAFFPLHGLYDLNTLFRRIVEGRPGEPHI